jgi:outer membrane protein assembly factor BamB
VNTHRRPRLPSSSVLAVACLGLVVSVGAVGCHGKKPPKQADAMLVPVQPPALMRAWKYDLRLRDQTLTNLYATDDYVFAITSGRQVHVFDRASGSQAFVNQVGARIGAAPIVMKDHIVYPGASTLEIYNRAGKFQRSIDLGGTVRAGAVQAAGRVIVGIDKAGTGRLLFVDVANHPGGSITEILTVGALPGKPATRGGIVFAGDTTGRVYAISEELVAAWALERGAFKTGGPVVADLAADPGTGGNVYAASTDTKLYAINALTGQLRWVYYAGAALHTGPTVTPESVYLYQPGTGLVCIDKSTDTGAIRTAKWNLADGQKLLSEDDRNAYVLSTNNRIYGVDKKTGRVQFVSNRSDLRVFATNTKDGTVFAATPTGQIIAGIPVLTAGKMGELVMTPTGEDATASVGR